MKRIFLLRLRMESITRIHHLQFFRLFDWKADSYIETGEHVLSYMYRALASSGSLVHPVIGFDRWDILDYQNALKGLVVPEGQCTVYVLILHL